MKVGRQGRNLLYGQARSDRHHRRNSWNMGHALIGGIVWVVSFAALGALLVLFAEPLWQGASGLLNSDSQIWQTFKPTQQASKQSDRLKANNAPANSTVLSTKIAAGSGAASATAPTQQALLEQSGTVRTSVRGLTEI